MTDRQRLVDQLILHEGIHLKVYRDTMGIETIGVGRNLRDKGLSEQEAMLLLDHDVEEVTRDLETWPWYAALDPIRQRGLCDLRFNLGPTRFRGFKMLLRKVGEGDYVAASHALQDSVWFTQVGARGPRLVTMLRTGQDYTI